MDQKKKPSHSALDNSLWAAKMLIKYSPAAFFIIVLMIPVEIGMQYLGIYLPSLVVSEVTEGQTLEHALMAVGLVMAAMLVGGMLQKAMKHIQASKLGAYRYKLSDIITRKKLSMFYQDYEKKEVQDLAHRAEIATQMWNGKQPLSDIVTNEFGMIKNVLGYLLFGTVISFASPWLVPLLTIAPVVNLLAVRAFNKWEYQHRPVRTDLSRKLGLVEKLPDDFASAKDIRIYGMSQWLEERYQELSDENIMWRKKESVRRAGSQAADLAVILLRDGGAYALLIWMMLKNEITVSQFVLYFAAISSFAGWVGGIVNCWNGVHTSSLKICDYRDYAKYPDRDGTGAAQSKDHLEKPNPPEIVFDRVCYRYDGAEEDTIHNLSFTIHSGERIAVVGVNGAGKTTMVKLLCGLYRPTSGDIRINGKSIGEFEREDYYRLLSPVFQDVRTAFFSLAETVSGAYEAETNLDRAESCIRLAGLGDKIDNLPQGIHTKLDKRVNKDGTELSGGEAQKLMLARALYKDAPILVLDEPTAALDPIAESNIYKAYNEMCINKTSLFISHRLASTSFCDRILLFEKGKICEEGTHEELLRLEGKYKEMFDIQSCWYQEQEQGGDEE